MAALVDITICISFECGGEVGLGLGRYGGRGGLARVLNEQIGLKPGVLCDELPDLEKLHVQHWQLRIGEVQGTTH